MTLARAMADMARSAEAVRVTVRRDGKVQSADFEVSGPDRLWVSLLVQAVRVDAEGDRVGAVLTFPGGERVTIGEPAPAASAWEERALAAERRAAAAERQVRDLGAEVERLLAAAGSNGGGCGGAAIGVMPSSHPAGARSSAPAIERTHAPRSPSTWTTWYASTFLKPSPNVAPHAPTVCHHRSAGGASADRARARSASSARISVEPIKYVLKVDGLATWEAISSAFERAMGVRLPAVAAPEPGHAPSAEEVSGLKGALRDVQEQSARQARAVSALRAALGAMEAERDSLRDALAAAERQKDLYFSAAEEINSVIAALGSWFRDGQSISATVLSLRNRLDHERALHSASIESLEGTFRSWVESERSGSQAAFTERMIGKADRLQAAADALEKAAEEVARVRKAAP